MLKLREVAAPVSYSKLEGGQPCPPFVHWEHYLARTRLSALRYILVALVLFSAGLIHAAPPEDFPTFEVPGHEKEMASLRDLFWLHYPGAGPKATLWDEWLVDAALWPAVSTDNSADRFRKQWSNALSSRIIDSEGYVATHQHASIAHQLGWPFPFWNQGRHGCGWHFSFKNTAPEGWRPHDLAKTNGWSFSGLQALKLGDDGWALEFTTNSAERVSFITAPSWRASTFEVPFLQLRWQFSNCPSLRPFIEWTTPGAKNFDMSRRMYFEAPKAETMTYTMVPMYRHPLWTGEIAQLQIGLESLDTPTRHHGLAAPKQSEGGLVAPKQSEGGSSITLQAFFSQYDTRHNINAQNFIRGCAKYFWWTHDLEFLRANINRMRTAMRFTMSEFHTLERKAIYTTWVGHDGRSGLKRNADGKKEIITGEGIGNNYWDLLPFGNLDAYASVQYYDSVLTLARIEQEIANHPEWSIEKGGLAFDPVMLERHAADVKAEGNKLFWNRKAGRFVACVDADGKTHDYGYTFLNNEAIYYDFATPEHAKQIMNWLDGARMVSGDTAQGADIYHWRFGPRATTKRNLDWYFWAWSDPESIPWGGQVQDGGAVLGFSYHDLMARLKTLGPENASKRLQEVARWFNEVQAEGGYRKYYNGSRKGTVQGAGTPGGLGFDAEFFESVLVPQVMLRGFMGFVPRGDGFELNPRLPREWPELTIDRIRFRNVVLKIRATHSSVDIEHHGETEQPCFAYINGTRQSIDWGKSSTSILLRQRY